MSPAVARIKPNACRIGYIALVIVLVAAVYRAGVSALVEEWWSHPEHSQGLVIVPFAVLLVWLRRRSVAAAPVRPEPRGLLLAGAGCGLHLFGELAAGMYVSQLSLVIVLAGAIWTFWGAARLRALALPILLLTTAIPLPSLVYATLSMPLQLLSSTIACWVADTSGIAVYREGNIIHLAGMSIGVWEACSGLDSLSALVSGSVLLGFALCRRSLTRMLVCMAAVPIALTSNIARIAGTALLSDSHPAYAMNFYHAFSGWLVFLVGATGLCGAAIGLRRMFEK